MQTKWMVAMLLMVASLCTAQEMKILSGNFQNLKPIAEYNLVFDYAGVKVDRMSEDDFLVDKMKKRESAGRDQEFKNTWFGDRESKYEPKFMDSFNSRFGKNGMKSGKGLTAAKYTMNIKTTWIHPGFNVFVMHNSALLNTVVTVFETSNPANVLLSAQYDRVPGKGIFTPLGFFDYDTGYRISEAYAKLAKSMAAQIKRKPRT
jgi:hypothetical protein